MARPWCAMMILLITLSSQILISGLRMTSAMATNRTVQISANVHGVTESAGRNPSPNIGPPSIGAYDAAVLADRPWSYWPMGSSGDEANCSSLADASKRSSLSQGRFWGQTIRTKDCKLPPCALCVAGEDGHGPYTSFDSDAAAFFPSFYLPPVTAFTIELWFRPACETSEDSVAQSFFRAVASPALLTLGLARGKVVLEVGLNDPVSNNTYFADVFRASTQRAIWNAGEWHQIAMSMNGTHIFATVNGSLVGPPVFLDSYVKQLGPPCTERRAEQERCVGTSGVLLADGFNGDLKGVSVYERSLSPARLKAHFKAMVADGGAEAASSAWSDGEVTDHVGGAAWAEASEAWTGTGSVGRVEVERVDWYGEGLAAQAAGPRAEAAASQSFALAECRAGFLQSPPATADFRVWVGVACGVLALAVLFTATSLAQPSPLGLPMYTVAVLSGTAGLFAAAYCWVAAGAIQTLWDGGKVPEPMLSGAGGVATADWGAGDWTGVGMGQSFLASTRTRPSGEEWWVWQVGEVMLQCSVWAGLECGGLLLLLLASGLVDSKCGVFLILLSGLMVALGEGLAILPSVEVCDGSLSCMEESVKDQLPLFVTAFLSLAPAWVLLVPPWGKGIQRDGVGATPQSGWGGWGVGWGEGFWWEVWGRRWAQLGRVGGQAGESNSRGQRRSEDGTRDGRSEDGEVGAGAGWVDALTAWWFTYAGLQRVVWLLIHGTADPGPWDGNHRLLLQAGVQGAGLVGMAGVLWSSRAEDWPSLGGMLGWGERRPDGYGGMMEEAGESGSSTPTTGLSAGFASADGRGRSGGELSNPHTPTTPTPQVRTREIDDGEEGEGAGGVSVMVDTFTGSEDTNLTPFPVPSSPSTAQSANTPYRPDMLLRQLTAAGYVTWKDHISGSIHATHGALFFFTWRVALVVLGVVLVAFVTILLLLFNIPPSEQLAVNCTTRLSDLIAFPSNATLLVQCPAGCARRRNKALEAAQKAIPFNETSDVSPLWGWNDVYGGGIRHHRVYAEKSAVCRAGVHANAFSFWDGGGCLAVHVGPGLDRYEGSSRNGVKSRNLTLDTPSQASITLAPAGTLCLYRLRQYIGICMVPLGVALVMLAPSPWITWVVCAATTFWFAALVGQNGSFPDPLPWHRFWILILFTPGMYVMGPIFVLRSPPWHPPLPCFAKALDWLSLPPPVNSPWGLWWRNVLFFLCPMLGSSILKRFLRSPDTLDLHAIGDFWSAAILCVVALIIYASVATVYNLPIGPRPYTLLRFFVVYGATLFAIAFLAYNLRAHHTLLIQQYIFFGALLPLTGYDHHVFAVVQGGLLGTAIEGLVSQETVSMWQYDPPKNF